MDVTQITLFPPRVLVLAAGAGSRMGGPKVFATLHQKPFGVHVASTLTALRWPAVWVLREPSQIAQVRTWLPTPQCHIVLNSQGDMFSSIVAGLYSLRSSRDEYFCIWPIDFPLIRPQTLLQLEKTIHEGYDAVFPMDTEGQVGHPPFMRRHVLTRWVSALPATGGLRAAMATSSCRMLHVPTSDPACFVNLNTPADVRAFEERRTHNANSDFATMF